MPITSLDVLSVGKAWPPACEAPRLKNYTDGRALLSGAHSDVFTDIVRLIQRDRRRTMTYIALAYPRRIVKAFGDMVLGEQPRFKAASVDATSALPDEATDPAPDGPTEVEDPAQEQVEAYVEEMDLCHEAYQALTDIQSCGDGVLKVTLADKGVAGLYPDINAVDPCIWYPVVDPEDKQAVTAHILAWTWDTVEGRKTTHQFKAEVHEPGTVTTYVGTLDRGKIAVLEEAVSEDGTPNPQQTGVDECLVVPVFNFRSTADSTGTSDFVDLAPILQEMEVRLYLIASILDKHSDPKLYGPRSLVSQDPLTGEATVAQTDYVPLEAGEQAPGYVTWEGQLLAAYKELEWLADRAMFVMEATPALFGDIAGNVASGAALKRLLIAPIMKASRLRNRLDIALKKALRLASLLHATVDSTVAIFGDIDIEWSDGLPADELEQTTTHALAVTSKIESIEDAVRALYGVDGDELIARMDRLAASVPPPLPANPFSPRITLTPLGDVKAPEGAAPPVTP